MSIFVGAGPPLGTFLDTTTPPTRPVVLDRRRTAMPLQRRERTYWRSKLKVALLQLGVSQVILSMPKTSFIAASNDFCNSM